MHFPDKELFITTKQK